MNGGEGLRGAGERVNAAHLGVGVQGNGNDACNALVM